MRKGQSPGSMPEIPGVMADEPDGSVQVIDDLGDGEAGLTAVDHGEDRVSALGERVDDGGLEGLTDDRCDRRGERGVERKDEPPHEPGPDIQ